MPRSSRTPGPAVRLALAAAALVALPAVARADGYQARVIQVDRSRYPTVAVYVSVTDAGGRPVPADVPLAVEVSEGGQPVVTAQLGAGGAKRDPGPVTVALVLDTSGSMQGSKLDAAKAAATAFVRLAPPNYRIGLIRFDSSVETVSPPTDDRALLEREIARLATRGATALQDGIGAGIEMLDGVPGRRVVLALTDGEENESRRWPGLGGQQPLIDLAAEKGCTVSVIGLGHDVKQDYLRRYEQTGGYYLFSPDEGQLRGRFEEARQTLQEEWRFEYTSPAGADGRQQRVTVRLLLDGREVSADSARYVSPGLVPNVRGAHLPFLVVLLGLAVGPRATVAVRYWLAVRRFRTECVRRLAPSDPQVGRNDPNGGRLAAGQLVVLCPSCTYPHQVRTWRYNKCRCMREGDGKGRYCHAALLPRWLRYALHRLTGRKVGDDGRSWLCRCEGDTEGY